MAKTRWQGVSTQRGEVAAITAEHWRSGGDVMGEMWR